MAAATKLTPQQQRDRRAKIMLAVLGVLLLGVLGFQLPKIMHSGGAAAADTAPPVAPSATTPGAPAPAAALATAAAPAAGQLVRFSRFAPKNPFKPLVIAGGAAASSPGTTTTAPAKPKPAPKPKTTTFSVTRQKQVTASVPTGPQVPAALLLVNGKKRVLTLDTPFPERLPLFRITSLGPKTVWIELISGTFANGSRTLKLERGRQVVLMNTTSGTRYVLRLVKPTTAPAPSPKAQAPPATTTLSATTVSTQTSTTVTPPTGASG